MMTPEPRAFLFGISGCSGIWKPRPKNRRNWSCISDEPNDLPLPDLPVTSTCTTLGITFCTIGANEFPSFGSRSIGTLSVLIERGGFWLFSFQDPALNATVTLATRAAPAIAATHTEVLCFAFMV